VRHIETLREQLVPREYAVLLSGVGCWIDRERKRQELAIRRWGA
jgi:hypothetical protein